MTDAAYGQAQPVLATRIGVQDSDYTTGEEVIVGYVSLTGSRTVTLGPARVGQRLIIKDESGACSASQALRVIGLIDGASSREITAPYGRLYLYFNGSSWSEVR